MLVLTSTEALLKRSKGIYRGAIKDYDKAIELDPNDAKAYNFRGYAKWLLGNNDGAMKDFDQAIGLDPYYANAYNFRGVAKFSLKGYRGKSDRGFH